MDEQERELHPVVVLSKYFTWASYMRTEFDKVLPKFTKTTPWNDPVAIEMFMFMSHWYATLYVVVEGWRELDLHAPEIDRLLESPNVEMLKRYRHGVYHFQKTYFDKRYMPFMNSPGAVLWVRGLHQAFFTYLGVWFKEHHLDGSGRTAQ